MVFLALSDRGPLHPVMHRQVAAPIPAASLDPAGRGA